ncbi:MAG: DUF420 domain-containing protein [Thermoleophilia bacterium]
MNDPATGAGLLAAKAPFGADVSLVLTVLAAVLLTIGWRLAVQRRYEAHRWVQTAAVVLNAIVVAAWMIRSFVLYVLPVIPAKLDQRSYAVATVHALVGALGVVLGVFVVLRGNELVPARLRFKDYRLFMRSSYALYLLATLTGAILFVVAYGGSFR